jgi:mevalonate pyrophosphate decarboxylase
MAESCFYLNGQITSDVTVDRVINGWKTKCSSLPTFCMYVRSSFTAPGIGGSGALMAGISKALAQLAGMGSEHSLIAELAAVGSGSAARSSLDGFVVWSQDTGVVSPILTTESWGNFRVIVVITSRQSKYPPSHLAHERAKETALFTERAKYAHEELAPRACQAI